MTDLYGVVIKVGSEKTAKVRIERSYMHPKYKKRIKVYSKLSVHDELGVEVGDKVCIASSKPISKTKRHTIKSKM